MLETRNFSLIRRSSASRLFDLVDRLLQDDNRPRNKSKHGTNKKRPSESKGVKLKTANRQGLRKSHSAV